MPQDGRQGTQGPPEIDWRAVEPADPIAALLNDLRLIIGLCDTGYADCGCQDTALRAAVDAAKLTIAKIEQQGWGGSTGL